MKAVEERTRHYLNLATGYAILMALVGLFFILFPDAINSLIRWGLTFTLVAAGAYLIASDLSRSRRLTFISGSIVGAFMLVMGLVIAFHPAILDIVPILVGIWMIVSSVSSLRLASIFKDVSVSSFIATLMLSTLSIVAGIFLIVHPGIGNLALTTVIGIAIMVYSISGLIDVAIFRSHLDAITDYLHENAEK